MYKANRWTKKKVIILNFSGVVVQLDDKIKQGAWHLSRNFDNKGEKLGESKKCKNVVT